MSAVSRAVSLPAAPIAMPTSAAARAGASLTPSPTIATEPYADFNSRTAATLSSGSSPARTSRDAQFRRDAFGGRGLIAGQHHDVGDAAGSQGLDRRRRRLARGVGHGQHADGAAPVRHHDDGVAVVLHRGQVPLLHGRTHAPLFEQAVVPGQRRRAVDQPLGAQPRQRLVLLPRRRDDALPRSPPEDGLRDRDGSTAPRAPPRRAALRARVEPLMRLDARHLGRAARQRARLVERHARDARQRLEVPAALDEHALARRAGQRRHDRHRRRDHQRARARDHQQHERAIRPRGEGLRRTAAAARSRWRRPARPPPACRRARTARRRSATAPARTARAGRGR